MAQGSGQLLSLDGNKVSRGGQCPGSLLMRSLSSEIQEKSCLQRYFIFKPLQLYLALCSGVTSDGAREPVVAQGICTEVKSARLANAFTPVLSPWPNFL